MKCKNCGKRIKKQELFCPSCGYYNGDATAVSWDDDQDLLAEEIKEEMPLKEENENPKEENNEKEENIEEEFVYENEDLLEDFIGEDYKSIKKGVFNIWAFLLSWIYFLYRKTYIIGTIGIFITGLVVLFARSLLPVYIIICMIAGGFAFNPLYIMIAKRKIDKMINEDPDNDRYTLSNQAMEKGGVSLVSALLIYSVFLIIIFFLMIPFQYNKNHNANFWQENSENQANCISLIKTAYNNLEEEFDLGEISEAACKITKKPDKKYEIYLKTTKEDQFIYSYYQTENNYLRYYNNTEKFNELEMKNTNGTITPEEISIYNTIKDIESNYQDIYNQSNKEAKLIEEKKNITERTNYIFSREEIIR